MTDKQIQDLYFHPRNKHGSLEKPAVRHAVARTQAEADSQMVELLKALGKPNEEILQFIRKAYERRRHANQPTTTGESPSTVQ